MDKIKNKKQKYRQTKIKILSSKEIKTQSSKQKTRDERILVYIQYSLDFMRFKHEKDGKTSSLYINLESILSNYYGIALIVLLRLILTLLFCLINLSDFFIYKTRIYLINISFSISQFVFVAYSKLITLHFISLLVYYFYSVSISILW